MLTLLTILTDMSEWNPKDIEEIKKKYNLTQKALADLLGVSRIYVYYLEKGERTPGKTLRVLIELLKRDLSIEEITRIENKINGKERD